MRDAPQAPAPQRVMRCQQRTRHFPCVAARQRSVHSTQGLIACLRHTGCHGKQDAPAPQRLACCLHRTHHNLNTTSLLRGEAVALSLQHVRPAYPRSLRNEFWPDWLQVPARRGASIRLLDASCATSSERNIHPARQGFACPSCQSAAFRQASLAVHSILTVSIPTHGAGEARLLRRRWMAAACPRSRTSAAHPSRLHSPSMHGRTPAPRKFAIPWRQHHQAVLGLAPCSQLHATETGYMWSLERRAGHLLPSLAPPQTPCWAPWGPRRC